MTRRWVWRAGAAAAAVMALVVVAGCGPGQEGAFRVDWERELEGISPDLGGVAVDDGRAFYLETIGYGGRLTAVDVADGEVLWRAELPALPKPGIAAAGGRVSVLAQNGAVEWCVFDAADGQRRWCDAGGQQLADTLDLDPEGLSEGQFGFGRGGIGVYMPKVAVGDDGLFVTAPTGQLVAVEPDEPVARWSVEYGRTALLLGGGDLPWVVADERGPITEVDGELAAFDAVSGQPRWRADVGKLPQSLVGLAVADGAVYVASVDAFHAVDADNGEIRWSTPLEGARTSQPVVDGDTVYVAVTDDDLGGRPGNPLPGRAHAFDVDTGEPAWDQPLAITTAPDSRGDARRIDLAALQGGLVVHADGLYLVEADSGERLGRWEGYDPEHNQYLGATDDSVILYRDTPGETVVRLTPNP